jgi:hypothetical protein
LWTSGRLSRGSLARLASVGAPDDISTSTQSSLSSDLFIAASEKAPAPAPDDRENKGCLVVLVVYDTSQPTMHACVRPGAGPKRPTNLGSGGGGPWPYLPSPADMLESVRRTDCRHDLPLPRMLTPSTVAAGDRRAREDVAIHRCGMGSPGARRGGQRKRQPSPLPVRHPSTTRRGLPTSPGNARGSRRRAGARRPAARGRS